MIMIDSVTENTTTISLCWIIRFKNKQLNIDKCDLVSVHELELKWKASCLLR